jgi:hypothetical protein
VEMEIVKVEKNYWWCKEISDHDPSLGSFLKQF